MPKNNPPDSACEFWSASERSCKVCHSGLFIPLGDHIEIYCQTGEHTQCIQYNMHIQLADNKQEQETAENRRQHIRVKEHRPISLVRLNESGNIVSHHPEKANVLDLSLGGMRVNSRKMLLNDSIIQFFFGEETVESQKSGIAKVRWSCPINNDTLYQVGLEFQSDHTIEVIGRHLGQNI